MNKIHRSEKIPLFVEPSSMVKSAILSLFILLVSASAFAQVEVDSIVPVPVVLAPFEGHAYHLITKLNKHYYKEVEDQPPFTVVRYPKLDITDRDSRNGFPQVDKSSSFALVLYSEIDVPKGGTYGFSLSSDDGSKLWIENTQVIDNDGPHGFKTKANRICLSAGKHRIKLWYYQGWPTRLGLQLECHRLSDACLEPTTPLVTEISDEEIENQQRLAMAQNYFSQPIPILFDHWKSDILPQYQPIIADIKDNIAQLDNVIIRIEGHTDDTGSRDLNMQLSRDRAEAILQVIHDAVTGTSNRLQSVGYGADRPVASNKTEPGRHRNRRVEIKVIPFNATN